MADPSALQIATAAAQAVEFVGLPEARIDLARPSSTWPWRRNPMRW